MNARKGLTLIEVLIAIVILSTLLLTVTQSLLPVFKNLRTSQALHEAHVQVQATAEKIRTAWKKLDPYQRTCAPLPALENRVAISVIGLDQNAVPKQHLTFSPDCTTAKLDPYPIPAKRVLIQVKDPKGTVHSQLVFEVSRPRP